MLSLISSEYGVPIEAPNIDSYLANSAKSVSDSHHELRQEFLNTFYVNQINRIATSAALGLEVEQERKPKAWGLMTPSKPLFSTP